MKYPELWNRILNFELDDSESEFTFSQRLARDNYWNRSYADKVIIEYKKFIYLCCAGYGQITPSDAVDQAWHLHLTYTRSYWIDLCKDTLGRELHHNPTKGGDSEKRKYSNCYDAILESYLSEFNEKPPKHIWPDNKERFSNINFKRINFSDYWLVKKPKLQQSIILLLILPLAVFLFIQAEFQYNWIIFLVAILIFIVISRFANGGKGGGDSSGCSWGCSTDSGCGGSGCSGCSGCGGCGGD